MASSSFSSSSSSSSYGSSINSQLKFNNENIASLYGGNIKEPYTSPIKRMVETLIGGIYAVVGIVLGYWVVFQEFDWKVIATSIITALGVGSKMFYGKFKRDLNNK